MGPGNYVWRDAAGLYVAPFTDNYIGYWVDPSGYLWTFLTHAEPGLTAFGLAGIYNIDEGVIYTASACAGTPYVSSSNIYPRMTVEAPGGAYFAVPDSGLPSPAAVTVASYWTPGQGCADNTFGMDVIPLASLASIAKPAFPFAPPFHVAAQ
jgi:hypothetical protein